MTIVRIISIVLLIYGLGGVIATIVIYSMLRKPIEELKKQLKPLAENLQKGAEFAKVGGRWIDKIVPIMQFAADVLAFIVTAIRGVAHGIGEAAGLVKSVENPLDAVKVPIFTFQTRTLDLSFGAQVITGVHFKEYEINLPGPGGKYTLYGPPLRLDTANVGLNLGNVPVVSNINLTNVFPLQPVGDIFRITGDQIAKVGNQIDLAADSVENLQNQALQAKANVESTVQSIQDFADKLDDASKNILEMSRSKLFSIIPALILGYFGLIHLAFALIGFVFLTR